VLDNPIGVLGKDTVERLVGVWIVGLLALVVVCAVALFVRYRRANATEREQIKWLLYACAVFLVVYVGGFVSRLGGTASLGGYIWGVFFGLSVIALPAAIGIAILRYRLYDIDVVINRTLVYGPLTMMLVAPLFRWHRCVAEILRLTNRPAVHHRGSGLHAGHCRFVQPSAPPYPRFRRSALLPQQV
jgi:hypothetical protein